MRLDAEQRRELVALRASVKTNAAFAALLGIDAKSARLWLEQPDREVNAKKWAFAQKNLREVKDRRQREDIRSRTEPEPIAKPPQGPLRHVGQEGMTYPDTVELSTPPVEEGRNPMVLTDKEARVIFTWRDSRSFDETVEALAKAMGRPVESKARRHLPRVGRKK